MGVKLEKKLAQILESRNQLKNHCKQKHILPKKQGSHTPCPTKTLCTEKPYSKRGNNKSELEPAGK